VVPLNRIPSQQWVEVLCGDPAKSGEPYVIRIHNDANYIVLPHTHPEDEHIVVVQGSWSLGMGTRIDKGALEPMELGSYGLVQRQMAHFGWAKTEVIIQVHGIGPFSTDFVDPVYELTDRGRLDETAVARATGRCGGNRAGKLLHSLARCARAQQLGRGDDCRRPVQPGSIVHSILDRTFERGTLLGTA